MQKAQRISTKKDWDERYFNSHLKLKNVTESRTYNSSQSSFSNICNNIMITKVCKPDVRYGVNVAKSKMYFCLLGCKTPV